MLTRRELSRVVTGASLVLASAPANAAPPQTRRAEVEALRRFAEAKHPRGYEAAQDATWRQTWSRIAADADTLDDGAYVVRLRRALGWFADGHTTVLPFEFTGVVPDQMKKGPFGKALPLRARAFDDGFFVVRAGQEAARLLGAKLTRIAGTPVEKAVAQMIAAWPGENPAWGHNWSWLLLSSAGLLRGLGLVAGPPDAPIAFEAVAADGSAVSAMLTPRENAGNDLAEPTRTPTAVESYAKEAGRANFVKEIRARGALYVAIEEMGDLDGYSFDRLTDDALTAMASPSVKRVVIDLRRNGGGNNYSSETLRRELARSRFNAPGGLYVLIAPQTFSAGQNLANRLERETLAVFVGEPTGSAPNLHGDPELFTGSASGITAMVSTLRWYDGGPHDKRQWILPDLAAPSRFANWLAGRDTALEAALSHTPTSGEGFKNRVRYFERQSQQQQWRPFWA